MSLLTKYLKKIGVDSPLDLTPEERETYKAWEAALAGRRLTDADVAAFLDKELDDAVAKLMNMTITQREDTFLKMKVDFIRKTKMFLASPEMEKRIIESQISSQLQ
jgi:hypothetical protein